MYLSEMWVSGLVCCIHTSATYNRNHLCLSSFIVMFMMKPCILFCIILLGGCSCMSVLCTAVPEPPTVQCMYEVEMVSVKYVMLG